MKTKYLIKKILRKIYHFIGFISLFIIFIIPVKAETYILHSYYTSSFKPTSTELSRYNATLSQYSSQYDHYIAFYQDPEHLAGLTLWFFNGGYTINFGFATTTGLSYSLPHISITGDSSTFPYGFYCNLTTNHCSSNSGLVVPSLLGPINDNGTGKSVYQYYDSDFNISSMMSFQLQDFYSDNIDVEYGDTLPKLKDLFEYDYWSEYESEFNSFYTTVNLDDYEYVLLTLRDYNQTQPFDTNLQVKGQIGITPIYNYGQTSKDSVTGVRVQDRCNLAYADFTPYPLYIIQSDLQNNVVYAVKSCVSGSAFKFDNTIFDITYVTQSNLSDPTVTINGQTYHTIPYADLPSSATQNEVENYIPGETGGAGSPGGLDYAVKTAQQKISEIWSTFTYFTSFVSQIFTALPEALQTVLIAGFTVAIVLGLIKIFIN